MIDLIRKRRSLNRQSLDLRIRKGSAADRLQPGKKRKVKSNNISPEQTVNRLSEDQRVLNNILIGKDVIAPISIKNPIEKQRTMQQPYRVPSNIQTRPRHRRVKSDQNPAELLRNIQKSKVINPIPVSRQATREEIKQAQEELALDEQRTRKRSIN